MEATSLQVMHIYEREASQFEADVNSALKRIVDNGGVVGDIKYMSDPPSGESRTGGFGALIIYEVPNQPSK